MSLRKDIHFSSNELERILIEIEVMRPDNVFDKREFTIDTGADRSPSRIVWKEGPESLSAH
jgi:hypothetical protein